MSMPNRSAALVPMPNRTPEPIRRQAEPALRTRTEPAGLVATVRTVPDRSGGRTWRPDLWPWWVWVPALCLPVSLILATLWLALGLVLA